MVPLIAQLRLTMPSASGMQVQEWDQARERDAEVRETISMTPHAEVVRPKQAMTEM